LGLTRHGCGSGERLGGGRGIVGQTAGADNPLGT